MPVSPAIDLDGFARGEVTGVTPHLAVARGVWAVPHSVVEGLNGVVHDAGEVAVIDTGDVPDDGRRLRSFVDTLGPKRLLVVYSHGHSDHVLGSSAFLDATVIAPPTPRH